ncbi:MAG: hypothetical protein LUG93_14770 [Lachnospiraceae bacterium]|nr:hypothetical protein [Lachnospiraceae bacterium]
MRKYILIILAAIALLWIASIIVYHDVLFQYISGSASALGGLLLTIFVYGLVIYFLFQAFR